MASFFSALKSTAKNLVTGFVPTTLSFEDSGDEPGGVTVITTALLAEGGYSFVFSAREVSLAAARSFAAKKVLAQDAETHAIAKMETRLPTGLMTSLPLGVKARLPCRYTVPQRLLKRKPNFMAASEPRPAWPRAGTSPRRSRGRAGRAHGAAGRCRLHGAARG